MSESWYGSDDPIWGLVGIIIGLMLVIVGLVMML